MAAAYPQQDVNADADGAARSLSVDPTFAQLPRLATPLKRGRTEEAVAERIFGDLARTSVESYVDAAEMDNLRSQKRFLSEVSTLLHPVTAMLICGFSGSRSWQPVPCLSLASPFHMIDS